ncbi:GrpB family protein [Priestia megaterium]|uniref:GrpB family protein n=1 Tax=Priestia megaterium TaxID=1404 RepID=UPI00077D9066|nr:GrpB family protein [Priestia megaterium]
MDKQVVIEKYTSSWALSFKEEQKFLRGIMSNKAISIEHIGSTSVKGLGAKPILDIMVGVRNLEEVDDFIEPLSNIGYEHVFHREFPNRRFFRKGLWRAGTHHLHIYKYESEEWNNNILFRDYLRKYTDIRDQYNQLKLKLAQKYTFDRVAYTEAKAPFITDVIQKAKYEIKCR